MLAPLERSGAEPQTLTTHDDSGTLHYYRATARAFFFKASYLARF